MTPGGELESAGALRGARGAVPLYPDGVPLSAYLLLVVCGAVGQAVQVANGALGQVVQVANGALGQAPQVANGGLGQVANHVLAPPALLWLAFAVLAALLVPLSGRLRIQSGLAEQALVLLAAVVLARQFAQLASSPPGINMFSPAAQDKDTFYAAIAAGAVLAGLGLSARPALGRIGPIALVAVFLVAGRWMLAASPLPYIDVFVFQRDGAEALLRGHNPYSLRYPDIYGVSPNYGPGLSIGGTLQFGFPYYPLSLLLVVPAHLLGDVRIAHLLASALFGYVIMTLRPSPVARAAGALFLFTPRSLFVLEQSWSEPLVLAMLALVAIAADRRPALLPWALGLLVAVKQYSVFMVPLAWLLLSPVQRTWRQGGAFLLKAALPGLVITLPFLLAHPRDFWHDVVRLQVLQPFRADALSFSAWWYAQRGTQPSTLWAFGTTAAMLGLYLWRAPRGIGGYVAGIAVVYLLFFATNKQAFCNYYYLVIGASALGAALSVPRALHPTSAPACVAARGAPP
jgi:hypothetical protein